VERDVIVGEETCEHEVEFERNLKERHRDRMEVKM
jgi:hypothetical protein